MIGRITLATVMLLGAAPGQNRSSKKAPKFADYPVSRIFQGAPAAPKLLTAGRRFRTKIRQSVRRGANFAGHYTVAEWGCGTSCVQIPVVDTQTGDVYEGPFGTLPQGYMGYGINFEEETDIFYRRDSALFIARGCPNDKQCAAYYYRWTGSEFTLLCRIPMHPLLGGDRSRTHLGGLPWTGREACPTYAEH
jgi:hypothetical protein